MSKRVANPEKLEELDSKINDLGFITVNGTTDAVSDIEDKRIASFPSGYNESNCIVVGSMIKYSDDKWYSNFDGNIVSTNDQGIWAKVKSSGFTSKPIKVVLMKLP